MKNYIVNLYVVAVTLFAVVMACVVGSMDYEAEERQAQLHCDMVKIFIESDGEYGWPDYNNTAEACDGT